MYSDHKLKQRFISIDSDINDNKVQFQNYSTQPTVHLFEIVLADTEIGNVIKEHGFWLERALMTVTRQWRLVSGREANSNRPNLLWRFNQCHAGFQRLCRNAVIDPCRSVSCRSIWTTPTLLSIPFHLSLSIYTPRFPIRFIVNSLAAHYTSTGA